MAAGHTDSKTARASRGAGPERLHAFQERQRQDQQHPAPHQRQQVTDELLRFAEREIRDDVVERLGDGAEIAHLTGTAINVDGGLSPVV